MLTPFVYILKVKKILVPPYYMDKKTLRIKKVIQFYSFREKTHSSFKQGIQKS